MVLIQKKQIFKTKKTAHNIIYAPIAGFRDELKLCISKKPLCKPKATMPSNPATTHILDRYGQIKKT
jgi:hypothetical protein